MCLRREGWRDCGHPGESEDPSTEVGRCVDGEPERTRPRAPPPSEVLRTLALSPSLLGGIPASRAFGTPASSLRFAALTALFDHRRAPRCPGAISQKLE